jgi:membrane fusion protein (multidrug efflux system)
MLSTVGTQDVPRLAAGMPVVLRVEGLDRPLQGRLARIAPAAEAGTRSIGVAVQLQNPQETLRAGQYAVAQVQIGDAQPRLTVPIGAISSASGQEYVWTLEQGKLLRRTVTTGRRDPVRGRAEVLDGLSADVPVLGARFDNLREGGKARIVATATAATQVPVAPAAPAASISAQ